MVHPKTLKDLKDLREALIGSPFDKSIDLVFYCSLENVIDYLEQEQEDGETEVLSSDR